MKSGNCLACHQLGSIGTRTLPDALGDYASSEEAWARRVQSGQAGASMSRGLDVLGRARALEMFADWTDRIAAGEVPPAPPRPEGLERNVVITQWDWADPTDYLHDVASTDRRDPTVNAYGPVYGALEASADYLPVVDPVAHDSARIPLEPRDPATQPGPAHRVVTGLRASRSNPLIVGALRGHIFFVSDQESSPAVGAAPTLSLAFAGPSGL